MAKTNVRTCKLVQRYFKGKRLSAPSVPNGLKTLFSQFAENVEQNSTFLITDSMSLRSEAVETGMVTRRPTEGPAGVLEQYVEEPERNAVNTITPPSEIRNPKSAIRNPQLTKASTCRGRLQEHICRDPWV